MTDKQVRIESKLHREISIEAAKRGISIKSLVQTAVKNYLQEEQMSKNKHKQELEQELNRGMATASSDKIYLIEIEYIGPDRESKGRRAHMIRALDSPEHTNLSREPRAEGYLGTTDNWRKEALGEFTPQEAIEYLANEWDIGGIEASDITSGQEFFIQ
jgi:hypothetical protein